MKNIDQTKILDKDEKEQEIDAVEGLRQIIREQNFEIARLEVGAEIKMRKRKVRPKRCKVCHRIIEYWMVLCVAGK
jgi:nitrate/TMAO reductase-like tetraheme cytochrome c subunit